MTDAVIPYLCCAGASDAIAFYADAFGAEQVERWTGEDGRVGHAELSIGGHAMYVADTYPEMNILSPKALGGSPVSMVLSVPDADVAVARAIRHGASLDRAVTDQPNGARMGWVVDPFGHRWGVSSPAGAPTPAQIRDSVPGFTIETGPRHL